MFHLIAIFLAVHETSFAISSTPCIVENSLSLNWSHDVNHTVYCNPEFEDCCKEGCCNRTLNLDDFFVFVEEETPTVKNITVKNHTPDWNLLAKFIRVFLIFVGVAFGLFVVCKFYNRETVRKKKRRRNSRPGPTSKCQPESVSFLENGQGQNLDDLASKPNQYRVYADVMPPPTYQIDGPVLDSEDGSLA